MSAKVIKHGKPSSRTNSVTSPYLASVQDQLNAQVDRILSDFTATARITDSYQKLYKYVEFLCRDRLQSRVSATLYEKLDIYLTELVNRLKEERNKKENSQGDFLEKYVELSKVLEVKLIALEKIYLYLDRTYLLNHPTKNTIVLHSVLAFNTKLKATEPLYGENLLEAILDSFFSVLARLRTLGLSDDSVESKGYRPVLVQAFGFLQKLIIPQTNNNLEELIIQNIRDGYRVAQGNLINLLEPDKIFNSMYNMIVSELRYWDDAHASPDLKIAIHYEVISELVFNDFENLAIKFVKPLFIHKDFLAISRLYKFIKNSVTDPQSENKYLKIFSALYYSYICEYLGVVLKDVQHDVVEKLVKSKKNLTIMMEKYMDSDSEIEFKFREAFIASLHNSNKDTEILNKLLKYIDAIFKNADPSNHDENTEIVNDIYLIFKSVKTKTTFIKQYQRDLSKRLIMQTTKDIKLEELFVSYIEKEVGVDQCKPLVTMFNDLKNTENLITKFRDTLSVSEFKEFEGFNPLILKSDSWPIPKATIKIPDEMNDLLAKFQKFYLSSHQNEKLNWSPALSQMSVTAHFKKGDKELQVSSFQGIVLLLFNDHDKLSFNEVKQKTDLDSKSLSSILYSLTRGKYKVLVKDSQGLYSMNDDFEDRKKVLKVKQIQVKLKNGEEEDLWMQEEDDGMLKADRNEIIKAFIVRKMKSEHEMVHGTLLEMTVDRFVVESAEVKRLLEQLLESEYIERVGTDRYRYIP